MSEFRQNIITKEWVLVAPSRSGRPNEFGHERATPADLPEVSPSCVFCPGSEDQTPPPIASYPSRNAHWQVRVVPNKFGLLELGTGSAQHNFYVHLPGIGSHEVVITRSHNQPPALQSLEMLELMVRAYRDRIEEMKRHEAIRYVHIIQNHGKLAGASLVHPHSQLIAMPFLGPHVQEELRGAAAYFHLFDRCIYCDIIAHERSERIRIVLESEYFLVVCPFESKMPYQMRLMPKRHEAYFDRMDAAQTRDFVGTLKAALGLLYEKLGNPPYNYYIHTMPFARGVNVRHNEKAYHWHLVIMPRINIWAGLELGTEVYVNTVPPEQAAEFLRAE